MNHEDDTNRDFIDGLLPWSSEILEICKIKSKRNDMAAEKQPLIISLYV